MAVTKEEIRGWFETGKEMSATHMLVVCDEYDYECYPVYVFADEETAKKYSDKTGTAQEIYAQVHRKNMQHVMEVYSLAKSMEEQLNEYRAMHFD